MQKRKPTGRIAQLRARVDELTLSMQKFCLDPSLDKFKDICSCDTLRRNEDEDFKIWKEACVYKYGNSWGLTVDLDNPNIPVASIELAFKVREFQLCKKIVSEPSKGVALKILHIFFAIGELKYIDLFYQSMGHEKLSLNTRQQLADVYKGVKDMYIEEVSRLVAIDPEHFEKLSLAMSTVDFSYFDSVKSRAEEMKEHRADMEKFSQYRELKNDLPTFALYPSPYQL